MRAGDFERTIARLRALDSPLAPLYAGIAGVDAEAETGRIEITLTGRDPAFAQVLALPSSAPLPRGTPTARPDPAAAGGQRPLPDPGDSRAGASVVLTRTEDSSGHVDRIAITRAGPPAAQTRAVLGGALDVMQEPAPVDLLPELRSVYSDRYREDSTTATVALLPDTAAAPLYDVDVRRAIGQALDLGDARAPLRRPPRAELQPAARAGAGLSQARPLSLRRPQRAGRPRRRPRGDRGGGAAEHARCAWRAPTGVPAPVLAYVAQHAAEDRPLRPCRRGPRSRAAGGAHRPAGGPSERLSRPLRRRRRPRAQQRAGHGGGRSPRRRRRRTPGPPPTSAW